MVVFRPSKELEGGIPCAIDEGQVSIILLGEGRDGYPLVLASMAAISLGIHLWFRRKGWM